VTPPGPQHLKTRPTAQKPSLLQTGSASPSTQGLKSRPLKRAGRAIGCLEGVDKTQQSRTVLHATRSPGSAAALDAGAVGAFETEAADTGGKGASWAGAEGAGSLGLAVEVAFEAGASPVTEGGVGVEQAARSASESAARSMLGPYHLGEARGPPGASTFAGRGVEGSAGRRRPPPTDPQR
jgi:hypothetical protein